MLGHDITPIGVGNTDDFVRVLHGKDGTGVLRTATCPVIHLIPVQKLTQDYLRRFPYSGVVTVFFHLDCFTRVRKFTGKVAMATLRITPPKRYTN